MTTSEKMFVPITKIWALSKMHYSYSLVYGHLYSFKFLASLAVFSLLSGALVACLKKISVESWPDLSVQSKFFFHFLILQKPLFNFERTV